MKKLLFSPYQTFLWEKWRQISMIRSVSRTQKLFPSASQSTIPPNNFKFKKRISIPQTLHYYSPPPLPPAYITSIPVDYRWISYFMVVKPLRRRLRILRKPCELLSILWQRSCFIFLQTDSAAACVHCGVPASVLDFLSWAPVNQLRPLLRILRKPC